MYHDRMLVTRKRAAEILGGISLRTLDRMRADGRLTTHRIGGSVRLDETEVRSLVVREDSRDSRMQRSGDTSGARLPESGAVGPLD